MNQFRGSSMLLWFVSGMLTCVQSDVGMCVWSPVTVTMTMATRIDHVAQRATHASVIKTSGRENFGLTRPARYLLRLTPSSFIGAHLWDVRNAFDHVMLQKFELKQELHKIRQRHTARSTEYSAKVVATGSLAIGTTTQWQHSFKMS